MIGLWCSYPVVAALLTKPAGPLREKPGDGQQQSNSGAPNFRKLPSRRSYYR